MSQQPGPDERLETSPTEPIDTTKDTAMSDPTPTEQLDLGTRELPEQGPADPSGPAVTGGSEGTPAAGDAVEASAAGDSRQTPAGDASEATPAGGRRSTPFDDLFGTGPTGTLPPEAPTPSPSPQANPVYAAPGRVWKVGPSVATVLAGLACLVIAGLALVSEITDVDIDWSVTGPGLVLGLGLVLVLLGLLGMARRHGRRS